MQRKAFLIFLIASTIIGCIPNRIVKYYEFTVPETKIENTDIGIGAKLLGEFTDTEKQGRYNVTVKGNPYELIISVDFANGNYQSATVKSIKLSNLNGKTIGINGIAKSSKFEFSKYSSRYEAYFSYKRLELDHETHILEIDIEVLTAGNAVLSRQVQMKLEPVYTEDKSNDMWSRVNSV